MITTNTARDPRPVPAFALIGLALAPVLLLAAVSYAGAIGMGGWYPDSASSYALRVKAIDAQLYPGMPRRDAAKLFAADVGQHPNDVFGDSANELDLDAIEPRKFFWNSFDTAWSLRATFDKRGKLIRHDVQPVQVGGP
jgi:hypothetical protein